MEFNLEEIYKSIFERSNLGMIIVDMDGHILLANPSFLKMIGYSEEEIVGVSLRDITYPEDLERVLRLIEEVRAGKLNHYQLEKRYVRKDGNLLWVRSESFLIKDLKDAPYIMELSWDITEIKRMESELNKIYQAVEQASDWVVITDINGNIEYANRVVEDITGYKREELLGKNPRIFKSGKHDTEFYRNLWNSILSGDTFYGVITNRKKTGEVFDLFHTITPLKDENGNITHFISTAKDVSAEKQLINKIECLTYTDSLTGLANRNFFVNRIGQEILEAKGRKTLLAVLVMDINNLTSINYNYGYTVGDSVLKKVGVRLREILPDGSTIARIGGNEFGILLINIENPDNISIIINNILDAFSFPIELDGVSISISLSIGISIYPDDGRDAQTLLKNAELAVLESKKNKTNENSYTFFSRELNEKTERFLRIQKHIDNIDKDSLMIYYQPYFDTDTRRLVGIEALSRFPGAKEITVSTEECFNVLEGTGKIVTVGEWIIDRVFAQIKEWQDYNNIVPISINISPVQFREKDFVDKIEEKIKRFGINPELIGIEITERIFIEDIGKIELDLRRLKSSGIKISIDDFGKGFSSLSYLKRLSLDNLKIDISFIRNIDSDPDNASIVSAIISMAHNLGIKTIAEGVETEEELKVLRLLRCDMVQGYLLSRPLLPDALKNIYLTELQAI